MGSPESLYYLLIHPSPENQEFPDAHDRARRAWAAWGWPDELPQQLVHLVQGFGSGVHLSDTSYLDDLPDGTEVVVGGEVTSVCVRAHLEFAADHPRVKAGCITFLLFQDALVGDDGAVQAVQFHLHKHHRLAVDVR